MLIKNRYGRDITNEMRIRTDGYDQRDRIWRVNFFNFRDVFITNTKNKL